MKKLSVVVPCYNESLNILNTVKRIELNIKKISQNFEIIFVDDGSTDNSFQILKEISKTNQNLKIIRFSRNFGHQNAIYAGIESASGDGIFLIDADLQDPPEKFEEMYKKWQEGFDVVYGIRKFRKGSFFKKKLYSTYHKIFRWLSDLDNQADLADFCLMDKKIRNVFLQIKEKSLYFRGLRAWVGFKQTGILYDRDSRNLGESKYSLGKLFQLAFDGILNFSIKPLNYIFLTGIIMFIFSIFLIVFYLSQKVFGFSFLGVMPSETKGFYTTILIVLFFGGINLTSLGIIGEYVGRLYKEVKERPKYIIKYKTNFN
jgi:glycosyltransferase involved in cell wall biosynthesis